MAKKPQKEFFLVSSAHSSDDNGYDSGINLCVITLTEKEIQHIIKTAEKIKAHNQKSSGPTLYSKEFWFGNTEWVGSNAETDYNVKDGTLGTKGTDPTAKAFLEKYETNMEHESFMLVDHIPDEINGFAVSMELRTMKVTDDSVYWEATIKHTSVSMSTETITTKSLKKLLPRRRK